MLPEIAPLPNGYPPFGPSTAICNKLQEGKVLTEAELEQLKADAAAADNLEQHDPDYMRASRRYRAQCAEEARILETRRAIEQKNVAVDGARRRVAQQREARAETRARRRERGDGKRQEVAASRDAKRSALIERIQQTERRTLVRETIQKALVQQSRSDGHAERVMFTHPSMLGDGPGPGAYKVEPVRKTTGASFKTTEIDNRKREQPQPGPGSYDPRYKSGPAITMGALVESKRQRDTLSELPGPGSYSTALEPRKGGTISAHRVKSELEMALERARHEPGPGEYELTSLHPGKSSSIQGRTRGANDLMLMQAARRPGPGEYELPDKRVRGGVMTLTQRPSPSLPALAPGPGAYSQTPTIKQEREMRQLSKQVVRLVKQRGVLSSASAPEAIYGGGSGLPARRGGGSTGLPPIKSAGERPSFASGLGDASDDIVDLR